MENKMENYKNMLYNTEADKWHTKEDIIESICDMMDCTREEAINHIEHSMKHGILCTYDEYMKRFYKYHYNLD